MRRVEYFRRTITFCIMIALTACSFSSAPPPTPTVLIPPTQTAIPTSSPTPYPAPEHRIGTRVENGVGEFYDRVTNEKFIPRGMNYVRLGAQTNPYGESTTFHAVFDPDKYDPQRIGTALQSMHADGFNVVRVFLSQNTIGTAHGGLSQVYMKNVTDFLMQAKQNQIYVMFTEDWLPAGKYDSIIGRDCCTNFNLMNLNYLSPAGLAANIEFFKDFVQSLFDLRAPTDAIFSYELRNEMFYETNQPPLSLTQGKITAANGEVYDMTSSQDKEKMVNENLVYWIDTVRAAILEKDPTALVSVGFFQPQTPNPSRVGDARLAVTEPAIWKSQADFIDLHAYPGYELSLPQYVENFGVKDMQQKPILMGEFGAEVSRFVSTDLATQRLISWQVESCRYGFDGWLFWTWDATEQPDFFNALLDHGRIEKALAPLTRPDACSAGTSNTSPTNLALNASVVASHALVNQLAQNAIDGAPETLWSSGADPKQWIEIDLGKPYTVTSIRLIVAQSPDGNTIHQLWVRGAKGVLQLIHEFDGNTADNQVLEFIPEFPMANVQVIRVVTTQGPSWVAWKEIEVFGK